MTKTANRNGVPVGGNTTDKKVLHDAPFRHKISIGKENQILYDCPLLVQSQADLDAYGISWQDCKTLNFHGSEKIKVFLMKVENRELAEYQWAYIDTLHSSGFRGVRCWIPGQRKQWVRCPDTIPCAQCPHKTDRKPPKLSWDALIATGYEPVPAAAVDEQISAKMEYEAIRKLMDTEDARIAQALEAKVLYGFSTQEIADALEVSVPRVYQLFNRAKAIAKTYRNNTQ